MRMDLLPDRRAGERATHLLQLHVVVARLFSFLHLLHELLFTAPGRGAVQRTLALQRHRIDGGYAAR